MSLRPRTNGSHVLLCRSRWSRCSIGPFARKLRACERVCSVGPACRSALGLRSCPRTVHNTYTNTRTYAHSLSVPGNEPARASIINILKSTSSMSRGVRTAGRPAARARAHAHTRTHGGRHARTHARTHATSAIVHDSSAPERAKALARSVFAFALMTHVSHCSHCVSVGNISINR